MNNVNTKNNIHTTGCGQKRAHVDSTDDDDYDPEVDLSPPLKETKLHTNQLDDEILSKRMGMCILIPLIKAIMPVFQQQECISFLSTILLKWIKTPG